MNRSAGRKAVAYTLTFGGLLLLGGRLTDYAGRRRMVVVGLVVVGLVGFGLASALGGPAGNAGLLFTARALQGAFAAVLAPAALSLLAVSGHLARATPGDSPALAVVHGYHVAFWTGAGILAGSALVALVPIRAARQPAGRSADQPVVAAA